MKTVETDALVIGGGAAGMAAALQIEAGGFSAVIVEREECLGGVLNQCIHNGFGLHYFKEELTGPSYAEKFSDLVVSSDIGVYLNMTVMDIVTDDTGRHKVYGMSMDTGVVEFHVRTVIFANGCRERNRGNIGTPGTRPSGIFTAGLAQRLVNLEGFVPGKECVIVGSGDIGLIMARRMSWIGSKVKAVVEIQPYPAGLTRNIVQCLDDFDIPLYLSHVVGRIYGDDRVSSIDVIPLKDGIECRDELFNIKCDTLLLAVGLVPDNELVRKIGIEINPETGGPVVDSRLMTSVKGIFACGNLLHVHDLVDFVTEESEFCGRSAAEYMRGGRSIEQHRVSAGKNVKYVVPNYYSPLEDSSFYLRSMIVKNNAVLQASVNGNRIFTKKLQHVQPSEMIRFTIPSSRFDSGTADDCLEVEIV